MRTQVVAAVIAAGAVAWSPGGHTDDAKAGTERIVAYGKVFKLPSQQALRQTTEEVCGALERPRQVRCQEAFDTLASALADLRALLTSPRAAFAAPALSSVTDKSADGVPIDVRLAGRRVAALTAWINEEFTQKR